MLAVPCSARVARLTPVTHPCPLSPSPDTLRSSHPRHRHPPASPGACPVLPRSPTHMSTGRDMGTHPWPLEPKGALSQQGQLFPGWGGRGQRQRGAAEGQLGLPQVRGVLQPSMLSCQALKPHVKPELRFGGASCERSSQNQALELGQPCSCLLVSPAKGTRTCHGHGQLLELWGKGGSCRAGWAGVSCSSWRRGSTP